MSNQRILISFVGGNDINSDNAAIEQLVKYLNPNEIFLFVTKEFENKISHFTQKLTRPANSKLNIIKTDIQNPSDQKEIFKKIKEDLNIINMKTIVNKDQGYINLTSGTPDIKCVFAILLALKQFQRFHGIYAPNPKYDNLVRIDDLSFYKSKLSENAIKMFIEKCEYTALLDYISSKDVNLGLNIPKEFNIFAEFINSRFIGNMQKTAEIYAQNPQLQNFVDFSLNNNLFETAKETFYSVEKILKNKDYFQSTLKLAVIRENLLKFINDKLLNGYETIADLSNDDTKENVYYWNIEKLEKNEPKLKIFLEEEQLKLKENKKYDFNREINAHTDFLILKYLVNQKYKEEKTLQNILSNFYSLQKLVNQRNRLAHTLTFGTDEVEKWTKYARNILILTAEYFNLSYKKENLYDNLNNKLLKILYS